MKVMIILKITIIWIKIKWGRSHRKRGGNCNTRPDDTSEDEIAVPMADSTQQTNNKFLSTDGSQRWSKVPINPNTGRMRLQNVLNHSPGPISAVVQRSDSVLGTFSCFITTQMLTKIAHYTNEKGQTLIPNSWVDVSVDELRKYRGLRLLAGVYSSNKEAFTHLWNKDTGRAIFGNTMARNRFSAITRCLRFDSKIDSPARRAQDKMAPIRDFCNRIFEKFWRNFIPTEKLCVDEQLVLKEALTNWKNLSEPTALIESASWSECVRQLQRLSWLEI